MPRRKQSGAGADDGTEGKAAASAPEILTPEIVTPEIVTPVISAIPDIAAPAAQVSTPAGATPAAAPVDPPSAPVDPPAAPVDPPAAPRVVTPEDLDISGLPELQYPGAARDPNFEQWAGDRRRRRIRTELVGGGALLALGVAGAIALHSPQVAAFAVLAAAGIGIYELLVDSFE
jgi:hypothetical protein